jgi:prevent-host-death family protein
MTQTVTIHEAKTHLSRLIKAVLAGREIVIARGSEPVAKLVPLSKGGVKRVPGAWKGQVSADDDAFDALGDAEIGSWEGSGSHL